MDSLISLVLGGARTRIDEWTWIRLARTRLGMVMIVVVMDVIRNEVRRRMRVHVAVLI